VYELSRVDLDSRSRDAGELLATASNDHSVRLWTCNESTSVAQLGSHKAAVRDVAWLHDGSGNATRLLSCSYDCTALLTDVPTATALQSFVHPDYVTTLAPHPAHEALFLAGSFRNGIVSWDTRSNEYERTSERTSDRAHHSNAGSYASTRARSARCKASSSCPISLVTSSCRHPTSPSERRSTRWCRCGTLLRYVWPPSPRCHSQADTLPRHKGAVVSNQVYAEAFTCPRLRAHPYYNNFVAQSNANYVALFSATAPSFKLNRRKVRWRCCCCCCC